jgi:hypothetical protein
MCLKFTCQSINSRVPCPVTFEVARIGFVLRSGYQATGERILAIEYHMPALRVDAGRPVPSSTAVLQMCDELKRMGIPIDDLFSLLAYENLGDGVGIPM